jgi:hypothetical protein
MTESEFSEQQSNRKTVLDPASPKDDSDSSLIKTNGESSKQTPLGKLGSIFEIQNTLDDTCILESKTNGNGNGNGNGTIKEDDEVIRNIIKNTSVIT